MSRGGSEITGKKRRKCITFSPQCSKLSSQDIWTSVWVWYLLMQTFIKWLSLLHFATGGNRTGHICTIHHECPWHLTDFLLSGRKMAFQTWQLLSQAMCLLWRVIPPGLPQGWVVMSKDCSDKSGWSRGEERDWGDCLAYSLPDKHC